MISQAESSGILFTKNGVLFHIVFPALVPYFLSPLLSRPLCDGRVKCFFSGGYLAVVIDNVYQTLIKSEPFQQVRSQLPSNAETGLQIKGVAGSLMAALTASLFEHLQQQVLLIVPGRDEAEKLCDDCGLFLRGTKVHAYTYAPHHQGTVLDMSAPIARIEALKALASDEPVVVVASAEALVGKAPPPATIRERSFVVAAGKEYPFENLLRRLAELGFGRKDFVEGYGDMAVRGGILDLFPFVGEYPVRLEFWGDRLESVREFDPLSQRSIRELQQANIVANLADGPGTDGGFSDASGSLLDYLGQNALLLVHEPVLLEREVEELVREGVETIVDWQNISKGISRFSRIIHSNLTSSGMESAIDFRAQSQPVVQGSIKVLTKHLQKLSDSGFDLFLTCDTNEEGERIRELIDEELEQRSAEHEEDQSEMKIQIISETVHSGFVSWPSKVAVITEHEVFGRLRRRGSGRKSRFRGFSQRDVFRLRRGDFVVHADHGVGKFGGLQTINVRGAAQEVMKVLYDEEDVLYVNLNYVGRVQKYSSREGHVPRLTKLGTPQWDRLKAKARKKIKDIARELITLYAKRKHESGFAFSPDTHWQKEMEASFMYEDTPDQAKATLDVKLDMENPAPMDRLVCGDVGFGKTEVAVRAAFKAVLDGKQVAVLVPTTILAQQHYYTFLDRLGRYTVHIEALTRFRTKKEQGEVLDQLKAGSVDILIGTHRLLSKDVSFKNLGLLVVDEEHRFGVSAKERLRTFKASVDTLTMTATPIPRTLQFSLMGARDLSLINTPPRNRLPIFTEIAQFDVKLVREAILKEMHRGGQVYVIHDRIQTMDEMAAMLQKHIPEARIHLAHGQMKGHELEKTMTAFLGKKYDVLVCTKIIESGIDIPSVNTIIINRADRFGLAELYQLRGRVGRSNVQAYAYLLTPPLTILPRDALQRLQVVQEFTELGSGFNLALRDMEIRGAGNLLGPEQSGFILEMGLEMYQRIVEEAVGELKEEEFKQLSDVSPARRKSGIETVIETDIEALIPDIYIESDAERLDLYRRFYQVATVEELQVLREELEDRFGEYPVEVELLLKLIELKVVASQLLVNKVEIHGSRVVLTFPSAEVKEFYERPDSTTPPFQRIMNRLGELKPYRAALKQEKSLLKLWLHVPRETNPGDQLQRMMEVFGILSRADE